MSEHLLETTKEKIFLKYYSKFETSVQICQLSNSYLQSSQGQLLANLLDHCESFQVLKTLEWRKIVVMAFHGYTQK